MMEIINIADLKNPDTEYRQLTIPDIRQRCIDFAKWIKKQNLMICTGYDDSDCNWRSSMIVGQMIMGVIKIKPITKHLVSIMANGTQV